MCMHFPYTVRSLRIIQNKDNPLKVRITPCLVSTLVWELRRWFVKSSVFIHHTFLLGNPFQFVAH